MAYYDTLIAAWNSTTQPPAGVSGAALTAGMTTAQKLATVNAWTVVSTINPLILRGSQIYNAIVPSEFQTLTAAQQQLVRDVFGLGDQIDVSAGTNVRTVLLSAFGAGTQTRANLAALATGSPISWCQANGYPLAQTGGGGLTLIDTSAAGLV